jgi:extradiol dioxygenase family protein
MFKKVAFTYYPVTDVARARNFYEETLGLKSGSAGNQGDNWWVEYDLPGGGCLALTNFTKEKPSDTAGGTASTQAEVKPCSRPLCAEAVPKSQTTA